MKPFFNQNANPPIIPLTIALQHPLTLQQPSVIIADSNFFVDRRELLLQQSRQREQSRKELLSDCRSVQSAPSASEIAPPASPAQEANFCDHTSAIDASTLIENDSAAIFFSGDT